jgi:putative oxidoreductase
MVIPVGKRRVIRVNEILNRALNNAWVELVMRWLLGGSFIYASFHKITAPERFAESVYSYALFPDVSINLIAIILPYLELFSGIALIIGIYYRGAVVIINGLLIGFITALSVNLIRGHEFDCGCFSSGEPGTSHSGGIMIVRDAAFFGMGLYVFFFKRPRKGCLQKTLKGC